MPIGEPTSEQLAEVCRGILPEEDCRKLVTKPFTEALNDALSLLLDHGVEDPETYLMGKGVLRH